jgi:hypothetical protein
MELAIMPAGSQKNYQATSRRHGEFGLPVKPLKYQVRRVLRMATPMAINYP